MIMRREGFDMYSVRTSGGTYEELLLKPTASMPMTHEASRSISFHWAPGE